MAPGVIQRGRVAISEKSGAPLAISPGNWVDGCPSISGFGNESDQTDFVAYLDPLSGDLLAVDVTEKGYGCSFEIAPKRWTELQLEAAE